MGASRRFGDAVTGGMDNPPNNHTLAGQQLGVSEVRYPQCHALAGGDGTVVSVRCPRTCFTARHQRSKFRLPPFLAKWDKDSFVIVRPLESFMRGGGGRKRQKLCQKLILT